MERNGIRWGSWTALLGLTALLLLFPGQSLEGAKRGVSLCLNLIVPSLFPLFVLSSLLISTGFAELCARSLRRTLSPLFGVGGNGTAALLLGLVGGYPVGARALAQLVRTGACTTEEAGRLSLFCNNCGPAFLIGAAGAGVFGSREAGFILLGANLFSALLVGVLARMLGGTVERRGGAAQGVQCYPSAILALPDCVQSAFASSLGVCAYVILFSVLVTLLDCTGAVTALLSRTAQYLPDDNAMALCRALLTGLLEISTGTAALAEGVASPAALPLAGFLLGWGGLSVHCQSLPFWREAGVSVPPYLGAKLVQGLLSAGIVVIWVHIFPLTAPVMAVSPASPLPSLLGREMVALWGLAGLLCLWPWNRKRRGDAQEGVEKTRQTRYNKGQ